MPQDDFSKAFQELEQVIAEAEAALAESQSVLDAAGIGGADALALLESQLTPERVAEVSAQTSAQMEVVRRDAQFRRAQQSTSGTTAGQARRSRQMI